MCPRLLSIRSIASVSTGLLALWGSFVVAGCASWPEPGSGGIAEHDPTAALLSPVLPDQIPGAAQALRFDLELASRHLDVLVLEGAEHCFPAAVAEARQRQYRINRELYGGLFFDGANDLIIQRQELGRLERQLDYVKQNESCRPPVASGMVASPQKHPVDRKQHIELLLNSDNQFAFDSSELNPKYMRRLAGAVRLLQDNSHYQLRVFGHADDLGDDIYNSQLSRQRAENVGHYLMRLGVEKERIIISAKGTEEPLFDGDEPHNRLVNRRVMIELVEKPNIVAGREGLVVTD